jgi:arylsulfatase A-like enzyme
MDSPAKSEIRNGARAAGLSLRGTLEIAAWFGLVAGFAEGLVDLTTGHFHAPAILCVTLVADVALFLAVGLVWWLFARLLGLLRRNPGVIFFVFVLILLYCVQANLLVALSLTNLAVTTLGAALLTIGLEMRRRGFLRLLKRSLPWLAAAAVVSLVAIPVQGWWAERQAMAALPGIAPDAPNVVLVILDAVRADHLSCYGYNRATSPTIDRLAKEGALFETAISPSSWTLPSHASIMTGTYPHIHQTDKSTDELPPGFSTLAWALREQGYRTAAFSANRFYFSRRNGLGQGFIRFGDFFLSPSDAMFQVHWVQAVQGFAVHRGWVHSFLGRQTAEEINRAALQWIDENHRPFFLALNYFDAHDPYVPPQPWRHRFSKKLDPGGRINIGENLLPKLTPAQLQDEMDAYDGAIAYEDHQLARLLEDLDRRGLLRNTLVVVTADHGEVFGVHGLFDHANALYFPLIHVPLVFAWPGYVPAGARVAQPVSTKDIAATILGLLGQPADLPGDSLEALWRPGADPSGWPLPIAELAAMQIDPRFPDYYGPLKTIVSPEAQYIVDPREGALLYDWKHDPKEVRNLVHDPQYQGLAAMLGEELGAEQTAPATTNETRMHFPSNSR